jgi:SNF2 family DNA or RNA helicase
MPTTLLGRESEIIEQGARLYLKFPFSRKIITEVKAMEGAKWHGYDAQPKKIWSVANTERNKFQLAFLQGLNPYSKYDKPPVDILSERPLYHHQRDMISLGLNTHACIFAADMRTGKSLAAIEIIEKSGVTKSEDVLWVGPKSALFGVHCEFIKWKAKIIPKFVTYESLKKEVINWPSGKKAPRILILDEAQRVKNPTAQRSQAVMAMANGVRQDWGDQSIVILMSGSPAPKDPGDWWHLCEVACPGFLREGTLAKFRKRLAIIDQVESISGGSYPKLVTWLDDERKCAICGQFAEHPKHQSELSAALFEQSGGHNFVASTNEVAKLYRRMKGLVYVCFRKDVLDLPEKIYQKRKLIPSQPTLNAARLIVAKAARTIEALTLLRELSDGFQYRNIEIGTRPCTLCGGTGKRQLSDNLSTSDEPLIVDCPTEEPIIERQTIKVVCPKDDAIREYLDEHLDVGRIVIYAGFTASIEKLLEICKEQEWGYIRADGQMWQGWYPQKGILPYKGAELLDIFKSRKDLYPKLAFIGQPGAAGVGIDLSASPTEIFYSNTFKAEDRIQSEARCEGPDMDKNRGCTIIDLVHLSTDEYVLENLQAKKDLQVMTLGELKQCLDKSPLELGDLS